MRALPRDHKHHLDTLFALRRLQILRWVLECRDHPAFRKERREWARQELGMMEADLEE